MSAPGDESADSPSKTAHPQGSSATLVVLAAGQATRYGGAVKPLAPVGPGGEAVIDIVGSDAVAAGFSRLVLVLGHETGPAIRYHVERTWPARVDVAFALQEVPRGTVDAVLAAEEHVGPHASFGVANADDVYGQGGLARLASHVAAAGDEHALVAYRLRDSLIGREPVTRGICEVGPDGMLRAVDERRKVTPRADGTIVAGDDREPAELDPEAPVSVNLWGFRPTIWAVFEEAMAQAGTDPAAEVLLPEVVGELLAGGRHSGAGPQRFAVLDAPGRCIGVTHPGDLALVQADLARQVGKGERPAQLWSTG